MASSSHRAFLQNSIYIAFNYVCQILKILALRLIFLFKGFNFCLQLQSSCIFAK